MSRVVTAGRRSMLGEVLTDLGLVTESDLRSALASQRETKRRLGETLVECGRINRTQLALALVEQYRRSLAAAVGVSLMCLQPMPAHAERSVSIALRGHVPARSSVQLANAAPGVFADAGQPVRDRLVAQISARTNTPVSVTLEAASAVDGGRPALTDAAGGARVPYQLTWNGAPLEFRGGKAVLRGARGASAETGELRISTAGARTGIRGFASEQLTVVVSAR
jgi:hypothetical protein